MDDVSHFEAICRSEPIQAVLRRHQLNFKIHQKGAHGPSRLFNDVLKFTKDAWTIRLPGRGIEGVNVHLESRQPGNIQIDVEPFPYEGSIEKDAARVRELQAHLELKSQLIETLRAKAAADLKWQNELGATTEGLKSANATSTLCAVKFRSGTGATCSVESDSQFIVRVINEVAPVLDRVIADFRLRREGEFSA